MSGKFDRANRAGRAERAGEVARRAGTVRPERRGVALMLAMVALGTATILTTAYVTSRSNSPAMGLHAQESAAAVWAAESATQVALAALQTEVDWIDGAPERLFDALPIAGGVASVLVTDAEGNAPDADDRVVVVTVVAVVHGVRSVTQQVAHLSDLDMAVEDAADARLGEFGLFGTGSVTIADGAEVGVWPLSPALMGGAMNALGVGFDSATSLVVEAGAVLTKTMLVVEEGSSGALQDMVAAGAYMGGGVMPAPAPAGPARLPAALSALRGSLSLGDRTYDGPFAIVPLLPGNYKTLTVKNNAVLTLGAGDYVFEQVLVDGSGVLRALGEVRVLVSSGGFDVKNRGAVEIADDVSGLRLYLAQDMRVEDAVLGFPREMGRDASRGPDDVAAYADPAQVHVYTLGTADGGGGSAKVEMRTNAIARGVVHAPNAEFRLDSGAAFFGRATGRDMDLRSGTRFLYDPALNPGCGFTDFDGPLYDANGEMAAWLTAALHTFDSGDMAMDDLRPLLVANKPAEPIEPEPEPTGPTPRDSRRARMVAWPRTAIAMEVGRTSPTSATTLDGLLVDLGDDLWGSTGVKKNTLGGTLTGSEGGVEEIVEDDGGGGMVVID